MTLQSCRGMMSSFTRPPKRLLASGRLCDIAHFTTSRAAIPNAAPDRPRILVVSYGSTLLHSLVARAKIGESDVSKSDRSIDILPADVIVVDCPLLSRVPAGLVDLLRMNHFDGIIFADVCKVSAAPLALHAASLRRLRCLPDEWDVVGAAQT